MSLDLKKRCFLCGVVEGFYGKPWNHLQRKVLFQRMKYMEMNVYLYAPKDDKKHRIEWRDLYSVEEIEQMKSLIEEAKKNSVIFVYAISPGIDITYSNANDINCLKRKLSQVADMGCEAFALLFDDIEPILKSADKSVYKSIGQAQAELTNCIYCHLNSPEIFIFCPTEYCSTRAVPDVENSEYLRSIGAILEKLIDIMWTGRMVISKTITAEEIKALTNVLQRPPLIWDNIHANDYDPKRVYLGPYTGRSPELRPLLSGILTNPNCEFEANYVAMRTLAAWSKADLEEARKERLLSSSPLKSDIQLEVDGIDINMGYQPRQALQAAVVDWLSVMYRKEAIEGSGANGINHVTTVNPSLAWGAPMNKNSDATITTETIDGEAEMEDSTLLSLPRPEPQPAPIPPVPVEILDEDSIVIPSPLPQSPPSTPPPPTAVLGDAPLPEPMEYEGILPASLGVTASTSDTYTASQTSETTSTENLIASASSAIMESKSLMRSSSPDDTMNGSNNAMETVPATGNDDTINNVSNNELLDISPLSVEEVCLLIDLCYLPYEHGPLSTHMLDMYLWLRGNAQVMHRVRILKAEESSNNIDDDLNTKVQEWYTKAEQFSNYYRQVCNMCTKLCNILNISVLNDLYPYVSEVRRTLSLLESYLKWLANGQNLSVSFLQQLITWPSYKECFASGNYEAWYFRGGLVTEFLRMVPLEGVQDLLVPAMPENPTSWIYEVRPYTVSDKKSICEIARQCAIAKAELHGNTSAGERGIIGERSAEAFLAMCENLCFVVEDQSGNICGYAAGAVSCSSICSATRSNYLNDHRQIWWLNHHIMEEESKLTDSGLILAELSPSLRADALEAGRHLLACLFSALRTIGVLSVHCPADSDDETDIFRRLGFSVIGRCFTRSIVSQTQSQASAQS